MTFFFCCLWVELSWVGTFIIGAEFTRVATAPDGGIYDTATTNTLVLEDWVLWIKYLGKRSTDLCQIHNEDVFGPSLGQVWMSRSKIKVTRDKNGIFRPSRPACGLWLVNIFRPLVLSSFFFFLFSSSILNSRMQTGCLRYVHTWCGLSANLECRSEMCCTRLAENTGRKNSPSAPHRKTLSGHICTTKDFIDSQKNLLNSNISSTSLQNSWDRLAGLGHPSQFQQVSHLGFVTAATSLNGGQPNFARCLAVSWAGTLCMHFGGCCPLTEFCQVQIRFASKFCVLLYVASVTARHSSSGR